MMELGQEVAHDDPVAAEHDGWMALRRAPVQKRDQKALPQIAIAETRCTPG